MKILVGNSEDGSPVLPLKNARRVVTITGPVNLGICDDGTVLIVGPHDPSILITGENITLRQETTPDLAGHRAFVCKPIPWNKAP